MSTFKKPSIGLANERVDEAVTCQLFAGEQSKVSSEVYYRGPLRVLCTKITCITGDLRPVTVFYPRPCTQIVVPNVEFAN